MINSIKEIIRYVKLNFCEFLFHFFPLKNKVVFSNFYGRGLGDDPKYILQALLKQNFTGKIIWVEGGQMVDVPSGVTKVRYCSVAYVYHICTAKIWVFNIKSLWKKRKRDGQFYIQTWHSTLALKKVERAVEDSLGTYAEISKKDSKMIDLMYTNNDFRMNIFKRDFWYSGEVRKMDVPRISVLINPPESLKQKICEHFHLDERKKIVLYAPTFRKNVDMSIYVWNYELVVDSLERKFGGDFVILIRMHPQLAMYSSKIPYSKRILDASSYPDMQELLAVSDVLINDFSSTMFEFGYMRKPVFLYAPDVDEYLQNDRGMEFDVEQLPFTMSRTIESLQKTINDFNYSSYCQLCDLFYERIGMEDHGHGPENLACIIMEKVGMKYAKKN